MGLLSVKTVGVDGQIYQEMQITATATPSAAIQVPFQKMTNSATGAAETSQHVTCTARGDNIIFKFGNDSTTAASATVGSSLLAPFNFSVEEGMAYGTDLNGTTQSWVSVVSEDTIGGTAIIKLISTNI